MPAQTKKRKNSFLSTLKTVYQINGNRRDLLTASPTLAADFPRILGIETKHQKLFLRSSQFSRIACLFTNYIQIGISDPTRCDMIRNPCLS